MKGQQTFAGTGKLLYFMMKRDRVIIPVWILSLALLVLVTLMSFEGLYPTETDRQIAAATMSNPAALAMTGPKLYLGDYTFGAMISHQMLGMTGIAVAFMSILLVTRHTRKEEETGRLELVRATVTGRYANISAALLLVCMTNLTLALILACGMGALGIESVTWEGSFLFAAALGSMGIVFAAAAIVLVQLLEYSRGVVGSSIALVAVAFSLRAVGDLGDGFLSWLSPIGWAQQTSAFVDNDWSPLLWSAALTIMLAIIAYPLSTRRDVGAGMLPPRRGRDSASPALTTPIGLAFRLQRTNIAIWSLAMLLFGMAYGFFIGEAEEMMSSVGDKLEGMLPEAGTGLFADSIAAMFMAVAAIIACIPALQSILKLRSEEHAGRIDTLLAAAVSRSRLMGSYLLIAALNGIALMFMAGLGMGITGSHSMDDTRYLPELIAAGLNFIPVLWFAIGLAAALTGWVPKAAALSWIVVIYAFIALYLGGALQLPDWMLNLSPLQHIPRLPAEHFEWLPLGMLTLGATALAIIGWLGFRRRDLSL
ncbi:ABC transporter permease [Paenibacillus sp. GCM10027626]|uniref:ABC transporter permease n=1 Tax=Paenibacillus sp. GCM10027626 TaxID=3273411 RepID=UPI00362E1CF1